MRAGVTASVAFHGTLIALGLLSLQGAEALNPTQVEAIPIDLIPIEEFSNVRLGSLQSQVIETPTPAVVDTPDPAQLAERTGNTEEDQPRPEETPEVTPAPTRETAPLPQPEPEPDPVPVPVEAAPTPPPPAPEPEPVVEEGQPAPQEEVLAAPEPAEPEDIAPVPPPATSAVDAARARFAEAQAAERARAEAERQAREEAERQRQAALQSNPEPDAISQIINNEQSRGATTGQGGAPTAGRNTGTAARLSQNQLDALIAKIKGCWSVPFGAVEARIEVQMRFELNIDGSLVGRPQAISPITSTLEQATASSVDRAIRNCAPFDLLPRDSYDTWRIIEATFRAQDSVN